MQRTSEPSSRRRLRTPFHEEADRSASRRSHSRTRRTGGSCRSRSRVRTPNQEQGRGSIRKLEQELEQHREQLRALESKLSRERSLRRRTSPPGGAERGRQRLSKDNELERMRPRDRSSSCDRPAVKRSRADGDASATPRITRSDSPTFTYKDVMNFINNIKSQSQPITATPPPQNSNNYSISPKNILPDFDPSSKGQKIDIWLKKVNECATVYGWDERTVIHFAMQKLQGLAKTWYESLNSLLFTWSEWQHKLRCAFPFDQNYGQSLEEMLRRKSKFDEPLETYYYEKLALLNHCDIDGKRAVECIIHGLSDSTMRSSANAIRCTQPDQLLQFLMSNKDTAQPYDRTQSVGKTFGASMIFHHQ
ncbi:hypothetical protein PYW07_000343 [Mythimna separata]|uniref:Retrotransposon gag domain-containing protein n=1 Tax=Mythimna separata TaxID=271217 RepID=A0AAD7Z1Z6_MYTSE|nr:hypothetical protein PYW07_000343 [Mythimna separata]